MRLSAVRMRLSGILVSNRGHLDTKALSYQEVFDLDNADNFIWPIETFLASNLKPRFELAQRRDQLKGVQVAFEGETLSQEWPVVIICCKLTVLDSSLLN